MVDWGRLLSGCWDIKSQPQVRILSSPLDATIAKPAEQAGLCVRKGGNRLTGLPRVGKINFAIAKRMPERKRA